MAFVITGFSLKKLAEDGLIIQNGSIDNCGAIKYDFVLGDDFLKADYGIPTKISELEPEKRSNAIVSPGEVVYVLTKESINIPKNMFMHLSANRGMSEFGVLTLGGFAVDPGYAGKLMFGLYNYSSTPFKLLPGAKLVGGIFYELDDDEQQGVDIHEPPKSINNFPPRLISTISRYSPIGLSTLEDAVNTIRFQFEQLKKEISAHDYSIDEIRRLMKQTREDLDDNNRIVKTLSKSVTELSDGLKSEIEIRQKLESNLDKKLLDNANALEKMLLDNTKKIDGKIKFMQGALWLATSFATAVIALLIAWIGGWLKF